MRASDLVSKKIININDGSTIGTVIDFECEKNMINSIIVEQQAKKFSFKFSKGEHEFFIPFNNIVTIGDDVILVNYGTSKDFVLK